MGCECSREGDGVNAGRGPILRGDDILRSASPERDYDQLSFMTPDAGYPAPGPLREGTQYTIQCRGDKAARLGCQDGKVVLGYGAGEDFQWSLISTAHNEIYQLMSGAGALGLNAADQPMITTTRSRWKILTDCKGWCSIVNFDRTQKLQVANRVDGPRVQMAPFATKGSSVEFYLMDLDPYETGKANINDAVKRAMELGQERTKQIEKNRVQAERLTRSTDSFKRTSNLVADKYASR